MYKVNDSTRYLIDLERSDLIQAESPGHPEKPHNRLSIANLTFYKSRTTCGKTGNTLQVHVQIIHALD